MTDYDRSLSDLAICNTKLLDKVYEITRSAKISERFTKDIVSAGRKLLRSYKGESNEVKVSATDLLDMLQNLYAKTNNQFLPILQNLVKGVNTAPNNQVRSWYSTARQVSILFTDELTKSEKQRLDQLIANCDSPERFQSEITRIKQSSQYQGPVRVGRSSGMAREVNRGWKQSKRKEV